jgi:hypothetical protein
VGTPRLAVELEEEHQAVDVACTTSNTLPGTGAASAGCPPGSRPPARTAPAPGCQRHGQHVAVVQVSAEVCHGAADIEHEAATSAPRRMIFQA